MYYATNKTATSEAYGEYQKVDTIHRSAKSGDKVVATLADDVGSPYTTMLLSPSGKKILIEKVGFLGTGSGMGDLVEINLEDGSSKTVYEPSDDEFFVVVDGLMTQRRSCKSKAVESVMVHESPCYTSLIQPPKNSPDSSM